MRTLVSAASRHGSTAEIAQRIAGVLRSRGHETLVLPPDRVVTLTGFEAVILGSAVYTGGWLKQARELIGRLAGELGPRRVWLFSSGPVGEPRVPATQPRGVESLIDRADARGHMTFDGRLLATGLGLGERLAVRTIGAATGDFRDWTAIEAWAGEIADDLDVPDRSGSANTQRQQHPTERTAP